METTEVTSITGYIQAIQKFSGNNIFYRGHSNKKYELKPGIYRGDIIKNEDKIYRETIAKVPYDFRDKNTLESLALMQHYGIPTRILDLTTNALVALYFACVDNNKEKEKEKKKNPDGEVIVFNIPEENTCYFDSDRVTILANLAKSDESFYYRINNIPKYKKLIHFLEKKEKNITFGNCNNNYVEDIKIIYNYIIRESIRENIRKEIKKYIVGDFEKIINNKINTLFDSYNYTKQNKYSKDPCYKDIFSFHFIRLLQYTIKDIIKDEINFLNEKFFGKLLHNIREDKPYFQSIIEPDDINNIFAVQPKLDNPRIVRQHGAFLIFGIKPYKYSNNKEIKPMPEINPDWIMSNGKDKNNKRIIIKGEKKEDILKGLEILGINKSFLFPEIDKVAEDIKEKYNTNK